MHCLTDPIRVAYHFRPMERCASCPHFAGKDWRTCHRGVVTLECEVAYSNGMTIAPHFCADGASIPRLFWRIIGHPLMAQFIRAALLHDLLYHSHATSRREADELFRLLLLAHGVGRTKAWVMWAAVRLFGWASYNLPEATVKHWQKFLRREK